MRRSKTYRDTEFASDASWYEFTFARVELVDTNGGKEDGGRDAVTEQGG